MANLSFLILTLIGITGVLNGFFLFFYLFFGYSKKNPSDKYLAFLVLILTIRIAKSIISSLISVDFIIIHFGLAAFTGLGPALFLYIHKSVNPTKKLSAWDFLHFIPAALVLLCMFLPYSQDDPVWNLRYNLIMFHILTYIGLTGIYFYRKKNSLLRFPIKKAGIYS